MVLIYAVTYADNPKHKDSSTVEMAARVGDCVFMICCWQKPLSGCRYHCEDFTVPIIHFRMHFSVTCLEILSTSPYIEPDF